MTSLRHTLARILAPEVFRERDSAMESRTFFRDWANKWADDHLALAGKYEKLDRALRNVSAQRTERANSTVKRMADIADAALKDGER